MPFGHVSSYMLDVLAPLAPLQQRISYWIIALVQWSLLGLAVAYLWDLCCITLGVLDRRSFRSTEQGALIIPFARTTTKQNRVFSLVGLSVWNWLLSLALRLFPRILSNSFYDHLKVSFQPYWNREHSWVAKLKGCYINAHNEWMDIYLPADVPFLFELHRGGSGCR